MWAKKGKNFPKVIHKKKLKSKKISGCCQILRKKGVFCKALDKQI
jgi:hypothetical protein